MTYADHLLPHNATEFERALSSPSKRILDVPAPIDLLKAPSRIPAALLPWLAWEFSIDVWDESWPDEVKRDVIARWFDLHRQKGTLKGISDHVALTGATVVRAVQPPQAVFWAPDDAASLDAWKATLPQIRIFPFRLPGSAGGFYLGHDFFGDEAEGAGQANGFYWPDGAPSDMGRKAVLWRPDGSEIDISWIDGAGPFTPDGIERFGLPGIAADDGLYLDHDYFDAGHYSTDEADFETVSLERSGLSEIVTAGYRATSVEPERVAQEGIAGDGVFYLSDGVFDGPDPLDGDYYAADLAPLDLYDRFYLFTPESRAGDPDVWNYYDRDMRYGIDPYRAELLIDIHERAPEPISFDDLTGYYAPPDLSRLWQSADAIVISKALRDRVLMDTDVWVRPRFGDRRRFGDGLKFEYVRA